MTYTFPVSVSEIKSNHRFRKGTHVFNQKVLIIFLILLNTDFHGEIRKTLIWISFHGEMRNALIWILFLPGGQIKCIRNQTILVVPSESLLSTETFCHIQKIHKQPVKARCQSALCPKCIFLAGRCPYIVNSHLKYFAEVVLSSSQCQANFNEYPKHALVQNNTN